MARRAKTPAADAADPAAGSADAITPDPADTPRLPDDAVSFDPASFDSPAFAQRVRVRRPDPFDSQAVRWPDGFQIRFQESDSRETVEIQFGSGTRADQPKNFDAIKPYLREQGMKWNGSNAWVLDLIPERGTAGERKEAQKHNRDIRTHVEDVILPTVIALEEEKRGRVELSETSRKRISEAGGMAR